MPATPNGFCTNFSREKSPDDNFAETINLFKNKKIKTALEQLADRRQHRQSLVDESETDLRHRLLQRNQNSTFLSATTCADSSASLTAAQEGIGEYDAKKVVYPNFIQFYLNDITMHRP